MYNLEKNNIEIGGVNFKFLLYSNFVDERKSFNETYAKELELYRGILETYKGIAKELKLSTALELSYFYTYLLWKGYFSETKYHEYSLNKRSITLNFLAANVLSGGGVCLEYASLLNDFLRVCKKESLVMACYVPVKNDDIKFDYVPDIVRNYDGQTKLSKKILTSAFDTSLITKKLGNHAITIINEAGQQFAFDATNLSVLNIESHLKASLINGNGNFDLKKYSLLLLNIMQETSELFYKLRDETAYSDLKGSTVMFSYEDTLKLVDSNKFLLDAGYDSIHSSIEQINTRVLSMKKFSKRK